MSDAPQPLAVTIKEAAQMLRCHPNTIYRQIEAGQIQTVTIGSSRTTRIRVSDLRALVGLDDE